jgi:uncharacterized membrane protein (DUF2068 family)
MPEQPENIAAWEDFVLRLIAVYKLSKTLVFIAIGVGLFHLLHHNVEEMLRRFVIEPMHFDPDSRLVKWSIDSAEKLTDHKIRLFGYGAFITAAFFATEGIGLYLRQHWAEYMVLFSTSILLPLEIYEMWLRLEWWKVAVLVANIAILVYLVHRLMLDSRNIARRRAQREARQKARDQRRNPPGDSPKILPDPS